MKLKNNNLILENQNIHLNDIKMICIIKTGDPFDCKPYYSLEIINKNDSRIIIDESETQHLLKLLINIKHLGNKITSKGNVNFANLGCVVVNLDYIENIEYKSNSKSLLLKDQNENINYIGMPSKYAQRVMLKFENQLKQYKESQNKTL